MTKSPCMNCFHYGKSLVTGKVSCVLEGKHPVNPGDPDKCDYFTFWPRIKTVEFDEDWKA